MNKDLEKIHAYLLSVGVSKERIDQSDRSTVYLAMEIMEYAHRNQRRENGEEYANHPGRVLENYRNLVGILPDDCFCIDKDLMEKYGIPYAGVQEVCLLHDVIEDTEFTMGDVEGIYKECGFGSFFELWIKDALKCITHDKSQSQGEYITICLRNRISAMAKMMDLQDNLRVIDLVSFEMKKQERAVSYLSSIAIINYQYHFLENVKAYKEEFGRQRKVSKTGQSSKKLQNQLISYELRRFYTRQMNSPTPSG